MLAGTQSLELNYAEVQSFTAHKPFLMTASAFGLGKKKSSSQRCYPYHLCTMYYFLFLIRISTTAIIIILTRMWANAQHDGRRAEYTWRPLFNATKFADAHY